LYCAGPYSGTFDKRHGTLRILAVITPCAWPCGPLWTLLVQLAPTRAHARMYASSRCTPPDASGAIKHHRGPFLGHTAHTQSRSPPAEPSLRSDGTARFLVLALKAHRLAQAVALILVASAAVLPVDEGGTV